MRIMQNKIAVTFILLSMLSLYSCTKKESYNRIDFFAMNTYVSVSADGADDELLKEIRQEVLETEKQLSAEYEGSDISLLPDSTSKTYKSTIELLKRAYEISDSTSGAFDFTLGTIIDLWDINGPSPSVPSEDDIKEALSHCGYKKVKIENDFFVKEDHELSVNLGAIAKGYAGQQIIDRIRNSGIKNAAVSIGGNVTVCGSSENNKNQGIYGWTVAINDPFDTSDILGTLVISDKTVSVSGSYERYFEENGVRYHHIFDISTGYPASSGLVSVAVIADDGTLADALSTALFVMGYEKAIEFYNSGEYEFEAVFCNEEGEVYLTEGILSDFTPNYDAGDGSLRFPQIEKELQ